MTGDTHRIPVGAGPKDPNKLRSSDQAELLSVLPCTRLEVVVKVVSLLNDLQGKVLIEALVVVSELVLGLAIWHLVIPEPNQNLLKLPRKFLLDIL